MWNSTILDVAIGLALIYSLLALICTTVNEWLSGLYQMRGVMLEKGIAVLLGGQALGSGTFLDQFRVHPLVSKLHDIPGSRPAYMAPRTFALAVMDLVTPHQPGAINFDDLQTGISNLPDGSVKTALLAVIQNANRDINVAQNKIEGWFNDEMNRVSGWYTRRKQIMTVCLAVGVTLFCNADTLGIANKLWVSPVLRQEIVAKSRTSLDKVTTDQVRSQLSDLIGWDEDWKTAASVNDFAYHTARHIPGWLITVVAVSLGSPFWFDVLNRFMNVRSAGKSPAEGPKGPRKDADQP